MGLTSKEKRYLRAEGSHLKPEVRIGKEGISNGTIETLENSFRTKELVKIKLLDSCGLEKKEAAAILSGKSQSELPKFMPLITRDIHCFVPWRITTSNRKM